MPLAERVEFKARLNRYNRLQVPKTVRWRFKLETDQILRVQVSIEGAWILPQNFYSRITKEGRIVIPKLIMKLLSKDKVNLEGYIVAVILEPGKKPAI